jgi:hypothetical protein
MCLFCAGHSCVLLLAGRGGFQARRHVPLWCGKLHSYTLLLCLTCELLPLVAAKILHVWRLACTLRTQRTQLPATALGAADLGMYSFQNTTSQRHRANGAGLSPHTSASSEHVAGSGAPAVLSGPTAVQGIGTGPAGGIELAAAGGKAPPQHHAQHSSDSASTSGTPFVGQQSCATPYISAFGSLPPRFDERSPQLNRVLLTHAPYMSKLESLASSATRWDFREGLGLHQQVAAALAVVWVAVCVEQKDRPVSKWENAARVLFAERRRRSTLGSSSFPCSLGAQLA